jgi:hypothetical protein
VEAEDWDFCLECCSAPAVGDLAEAEAASVAEGLEAEAAVEASVDLGAEVRAAAEPVEVGSGSWGWSGRPRPGRSKL